MSLSLSLSCVTRSRCRPFFVLGHAGPFLIQPIRPLCSWISLHSPLRPFSSLCFFFSLVSPPWSFNRIFRLRFSFRRCRGLGRVVDRGRPCTVSAWHEVRVMQPLNAGVEPADAIGQQLPEGCLIHPVFHVSQLKKEVPPTIPVSTTFPDLTHEFQVPLAMLITVFARIGTPWPLKSWCAGLIFHQNWRPGKMKRLCANSPVEHQLGVKLVV